MNIKDDFDIRRKLSTPIKGLCVVLLIAVVMLIGSSYAYYKLEAESEKTITLKSGALELSFDESKSNEITLSNSSPVTDMEGLSYEPYTFTLNNTGNIDGDFVLYLDDVALDNNGNRMADSNIKYALVKDNEELSTSGTKLLSSNASFSNDSNVTTRVIGKGTINAHQQYNYKLYLWIAESAGNDIMNKIFKVKLRIEAMQTVPKACTVVNKEATINVGDEIDCGSEIFNVISTDTNNIKMLAKYNLDLTTDTQSITPGTSKFSDTAYWSSTQSYPAEVYNQSSSIYTHVNNYQKYLKEKVSVSSATATLMTYTEAKNLGCTDDSCASAKSFVATSNYYLATALSATNVYYIDAASKKIGNAAPTTPGGVRPVVTISRSEI